MPISPKAIKIFAGVQILFTIFITAFFTYKYISGMNDKISDLSQDLSKQEYSIEASKEVIQQQELSMVEISKRFTEIEDLRKRIKDQEIINNRRIDNVNRQLQGLKEQSTIEESSKGATDTLRKRIRCLEVASGAKLEDGESCDD